VPSPTPHRRPPSSTTPSSGPSRAALAAALLAVACLGAGCGKPLPVLGDLPHFALTDRTGEVVDSEQLRGKVWIADFVFTRCPDFCPALTARMAQLQKRLPSDADPVRLVSFSVDPVHDTPAVLTAYAARAGAQPEWLFLTGPRDTLAGLLRDGFRVAYADDGPPTSPITHSDRFVLVDRGLRLRGYYHGSEPQDVDRLAVDAQVLRRES